MRRWLRPLIILAVLIAIVATLRVTVFAPKPVRVEVVRVERGPVEATIANSKAGTVRARRRARLSPGTAGVVVEKAVERGQRVTAGALLLRLDDATQRTQYALAERSLDVAVARHTRACISADRALRELERQRKLADGDLTVVSVDRLDALESAHQLEVAACSVAHAQIEEARAAIAAAAAELEKTELVAPFDAIIAEVSAELGEWVTPSVPLVAAPTLIDAIDPSSLYISAPIDEIEAARLSPDLPARVTIDSHPGESFPGRIVRVAPYVIDIEAQNRTVEVEVELEDEALSATLLPGTSADVEIVLAVKSDVVRVPVLGLFEGERSYVVIDGVVEERQLEVGLRNWRFAEVLSGLEIDDEIITHFEVDTLASGDRVTIAGTDGEAP